VVSSAKTLYIVVSVRVRTR